MHGEPCARASPAYRSRCTAPVPCLTAAASLTCYLPHYRPKNKSAPCSLRHQNAPDDDDAVDDVAEAFVSPAQAGPEAPQT